MFHDAVRRAADAAVAAYRELLTEQHCVIVDARIRVAPHTPTDPFLRRLRN